MDLTLSQILSLLAVSFIGEFVNSSLGMLYGTITSAFLISIGFPPLVVVPGILATDAFAGFIAAKEHHLLKNADFRFWKTKSKFSDKDDIEDNVKGVVSGEGGVAGREAVAGWEETEQNFTELSNEKSFRRGSKKGSAEEEDRGFIFQISKDLKISLFVIFLGSIASVLAVLVAVNIPEDIFRTYIGAISLVLGMLLLVDMRYDFSWLKMIFFSLIGAFTNALGGSGFGPLFTSGQIVSGREGKNSVGVSVFSESILGLVGFISYWVVEGIHDWEIIFFLCFGAFWGAKMGPKMTKRLQSKVMRRILGIVIISLGFLILYQLWLGSLID